MTSKGSNVSVVRPYLLSGIGLVRVGLTDGHKLVFGLLASEKLVEALRDRGYEIS